MSIDRKAAIDMATQAGFKYVDNIAFRGSYNKCTTNEKYEIDCLVRLCNLSAQDMAAERDALKDAARLALDALENIPQADSDCDEQTQQDDDAMQEAIAALQEAL